MATDVKNDATLSTSLVSYWELEEASGTRVDSHSSNDLTEVNTVGSGTGIIGMGADFISANSESLYSSNVFVMTNANSMSINGWVNATSLVTNGGIFCRWGSSAKGHLVRITAAGAVQAYVGDGSNTRGFVTGSTNVADGDWHMVTFVWDASADKQTLYVDGVDQGSVASAQTISQSTAKFEIGDNDVGGSASPWDGLIDEVGVWSKVLTSTEVTDLYNSGTGIPYDAGGGGGGAAARNAMFAFGGI